MILVAAQTPKAKSGWALGLLSSGIMAGNLVGPLIGGDAAAADRHPHRLFFLSGAAIFVSFLGTTFLLREKPRPRRRSGARCQAGWAADPGQAPRRGHARDRPPPDLRVDVDRADHHRLCRVVRRAVADHGRRQASPCRRRALGGVLSGPPILAGSPTVRPLADRRPVARGGGADPGSAGLRGGELAARRAELPAGPGARRPRCPA